MQEQERRTAVGSLLCSNLEEELVRLSLRDRISARETPGKEKNKPGGVFCLGVSPWGEPRMIVATKYCERCNRWFCQTHFGDPDWHSERALLGRDRNLVFARQPLSASQMAPAVLPISSSIVIPFPSHNPHRANTHHLRPIEAGEACSREPDPRPRKGRYILLHSILLRREMPLRISFTTSS